MIFIVVPAVTGVAATFVILTGALVDPADATDVDVARNRASSSPSHFADAVSTPLQRTLYACPDMLLCVAALSMKSAAALIVSLPSR